MKTTISVDNDKCKKDGLCAKVCPNRIFKSEKKKPPEIVGQELCCFCGQCIAVCTGDAISHNRLDLTRFEKIEDHRPLDPGALLAFLMQRRSVRNYKKEPVPREVLEKVAAIAGFAPSGAHHGDNRVRKVAVVTGEENMRRVLEMTVDYLGKIRKVLDGFVVKTVSHWSDAAKGGRATLPDLAMRLEEYGQGRDVITYSAPAAVFIHAPRRSSTPQADCDAALFSVMLAAHAHGLGTCWNGWLDYAASGRHVKGFRVLRDFLKLPDDNDVYAAATLGFPRIRLHSVPQRETQIEWID